MKLWHAWVAFFAAISLPVPTQAVEVYLFKGAGDFSFISKGLHFSRGLDSIARSLNAKGIRAEVRGFAQADEALRIIRKRRPKTVAFVGHSMGALASMSLARKMKAEGIKVAYVATLDIPGPVGTAGSNVVKAENYYSMTPIYGLLTNTRSHRDAKNIYVFGTHTTMDDTAKVKNGVLKAITKIRSKSVPIQPPTPALAEPPQNPVRLAQQSEPPKPVVEKVDLNVPIPLSRPLQVAEQSTETLVARETPDRPARKRVVDQILYTAKAINRRVAMAHLLPSRPINLLRN